MTADVPGAIIDNNLVTKHAAGIGFSVPRTQSVRVFNNISVGNTKNWGNAPNGAKARMAGNIGDSTDAEVIVPQAGTANATYGGVASSRNYAPCRVLTTGTYPMVSGVAGVTQLQANVRYYARSNATPGTLSLSSTETGTTFTFTDAGTGVLKVSFIWLSDTTAPLLVATDFPATPANTFVDFASGNYQPVATGVQVDNAYTYPEVLNTDALGAFRPSYNNGGAEYMDCGPFEFDKGFGPHPVSAVLTINNLVIGSDITILEAGTETILVNVEDHTSTNYAHTYTLAVPVDGTTKLYQIVGHIVDAAAGRVEFAPTEIQADQLPNTYYYDIQMTDASGRKRTIELDQYIYTQDITK